MSSSENAIHELRRQLKNIEYAGGQLASATDQYKDKLIGVEMKAVEAILYINDAANIVSELVDKIEKEKLTTTCRRKWATNI